MKTCFLFSTLPVFLLFSPAEAAGDWDNLQSLRKGERVQVVQMDLKSCSGDLLGVSEKAIRIRVRNEECRVRRPDVFRVSVSQASRRRRNALLGAAAGAGAATGGILLSARGGWDAPGAIAAGLALMGAGAGAWTGAAFPGYVTLYRAPKPGK